MSNILTLPGCQAWYKPEPLCDDIARSYFELVAAVNSAMYGQLVVGTDVRQERRETLTFRTHCVKPQKIPQSGKSGLNPVR